MRDEGPLVLHVRVVTGTGGGPDKTILHSPRFLEGLGYRALCVYMHPPGDPGFDAIRCRAAACLAPLVGIEDRGPWDLSVPRRLAALCRKQNVAIWHGHEYKSNALGLLVRRFWPMKLVTTVHGWGVRSGRLPWYYTIDRMCLRAYEAVICVSDDLLAACMAAGVPASRCVLIENAVDTDQFARRMTPQEAKPRFGLAAQRLVIGSVGRLSAEKNFAGLIRAVASLLRQGADVDLVLVGDGPERTRLEALVAELGLQDRVHILGYRADTIDLYQAMDIFVLNSLREGLPNVLLEAMAMELPVVATRAGGIGRLIGHECNGLLIHPEADDQLVAAIGRLLADPALRRRLGVAGRRTVESEHSFALRMKRVAAVYDRVLGRSGEPSH